MDQDELLRHIVATCDKLGLRYLVTGSIATIFYGEPRFTNDIDVVIDLSDQQVGGFLEAFPSPEFYLSEEKMRDAIESRSQFNIIHPASGLKVDVMIPAGDSFDRSRFSRGRLVHPAPDYRAVFASPEDVIIKKLVYYRNGGSDRHLRDIAGVLELEGPGLDREYIRRWAERLGLGSLWDALVKSRNR